MTPRKDRKIVLITGCSSGFGFLTAKLLASKGYKVYATMRDVDGRNKQKREELEASVADKSTLKVLDCNVLDEASIKAAVTKIIEIESCIDVLINNAGYALYGPIEFGKDDDIRKEFETDVLGYLRMIKAVLPHMRKQRSGLVINVGSMMSYFGVPQCGYYSAAKFAVRGLSEALLGEGYLFNIKVSVITPIGFSTDFLHRSLQVVTEPEKSGEYKVPFKDIIDHIDNFGTKSGDPASVAKKIAWILGKKNPPFLVPVGKFARAGSFLIKMLPNPMTFQRITAKLYDFKEQFKKVE
nr:SDR family oxidoreductase [Candidatus Sigynarchaeota archaeon]